MNEKDVQKNKREIIQWHPAAYAALELELKDEKDILEFKNEHELSKKPLKIDFLVIKKDNDCKISKSIGKLFRRYNIIEYKSPDDALNIDTLFKGIAYACLYKSFGTVVNEIKSNEISITFIRQVKPDGLFSVLEELPDVTIVPFEKGIYYIEGNMLFPIQFIVTEELPLEEYEWLTLLHNEPNVDNVKKLFSKLTMEEVQVNIENMASVLDVVMQVNNRYLDVMEEVAPMDAKVKSVLEEMFKPEINAKIAVVTAAKDAVIAARDAEIASIKAESASKDAIIAELKAQLTHA